MNAPRLPQLSHNVYQLPFITWNTLQGQNQRHREDISTGTFNYYKCPNNVKLSLTFWKVPPDQISVVTRQNFDLSCLRLLIFAVEVRSARGWWLCVAFVNVSLHKRSSLLIVGTRLLLIAASGLLHGIWSLVVQYDADGRLLMPTSTLKYMYTCQSISNTLCYDGHYKDGTNLMVTPPSLKFSPKACSQDPLGQKGTTWNGANARVGIRGKMIMEGGRRPRAGHCNMKGWNLFQPPPGKSNRSQCHLA